MTGGLNSWLPLQGIRVADFTQVIAGPACSMLLADMGADVIKIEPLSGDFWRRTVSGSAFLNFNRNKRGMAINLKNPQGHEAVMKLLRGADVPWQRVINYRGAISPRAHGDGSIRQRRLLMGEGIHFDSKGQVDFKKVRWSGPKERLKQQRSRNEERQ